MLKHSVVEFPICDVTKGSTNPPSVKANLKNLKPHVSLVLRDTRAVSTGALPGSQTNLSVGRKKKWHKDLSTQLFPLANTPSERKIF